MPRPEQLAFFGNAPGPRLFGPAAELGRLGGEPAEVDLAPLLEAARLLYEGPWVAQRYAAIRDLIEPRPEALHPVTRKIIEPGAAFTAVQAFQAQYRLQALKRRRVAGAALRWAAISAPRRLAACASRSSP